MADHNELGKSGEQLALGHLKSKAYKILETNWRSGKFEIDIIAQSTTLVVVVEVKTRTSNYLMEPEAAVTKEKRRMLIKAADIYVRRHNIELEVRFDIISIVVSKNQFRLNHIEDAFYPTM